MHSPYTYALLANVPSAFLVILTISLLQSDHLLFLVGAERLGFISSVFFYVYIKFSKSCNCLKFFTKLISNQELHDLYIVKFIEACFFSSAVT